ncbi:MAG: hypothetical protein GKR90_00805 [Pseudomonadales bacterium]|nr:hypothetical protein [Pseudomonadales bacterium]
MRTFISIGLLLVMGTHCESVNAQDDAYQAPRTWFGDPNLQGIWTNATFTTLERPDEFDKLVLTPEEAIAREDERNAFYEDYDKPEKVDGQLQEANDPGGYNTFWMDEGSALARVDGEIRSSIIVYPEDGKIPYSWGGRWNMIKHGIQYMRFDGPEIRPLGERCLVGFGSTGGPPMLPVLYNNNYQIVQNQDHVLIMVEMNHDVRTVRLNSEHPPAHVTKWLGDSIGWWEEDTLVVETTNFHPEQNFRAAIKHIVYASPQLKVTERFTRVGEDRIKYAFEMEDQNTYADVWRGEMPMRKSDAAIYEYACHEGNYAMPGILAGARLEEQEGTGGGFVQTLAVWLAD